MRYIKVTNIEDAKKHIVRTKNLHIGDGKYLHYSDTYNCYIFDNRKPKGKKLTNIPLIAFVDSKNQFENIDRTIIPKEYLEAFKEGCKSLGKTIKYI